MLANDGVRDFRTGRLLGWRAIHGAGIVGVRVAAVVLLLAGVSARAGLCQEQVVAVAELPNAPGEAMQANAPLNQQSASQGTASVTGVAVDVNGGPLPGARVMLTVQGHPNRLEDVAGSDGSFTFSGLAAGTYRLLIASPGFDTYVSPDIPVAAGAKVEAPPIAVRIGTANTSVTVSASPDQVAEEQVKEQEKQRVLGVFENFYTSYIWNAAPMNPKQKYRLALRATIDPVNLLVVAGVAGGEQIAGIYPGYGSGAEGFGKRYGARFADTVSARLIGGAILPSVFHQDPRYFYLGSGSGRSRAWYAMSRAVICRGDNGKQQLSYSHLLGSLAAGGISNLYRPDENRGVALTFETALVTIGASAVGNLFREFVLRGYTPSVPDYANGKK